MSYTYTFQIFDFIGMFFICATMISLNLIRMRSIEVTSLAKSFLSIVLMSSVTFATFSILHIPVQIIIALLVGAIVFTEFRARKVQRVEKPLFFKTALGFLAGAVTFSLLDVTRTWCNPESILQGHSIWHLFTAVALLQMGLYYSQWDFSKDFR